MAVKLKVLQVALSRQNFDLAAHTLVYGLVKAKIEEKNRKDAKKRSAKGQSERP